MNEYRVSFAPYWLFCSVFSAGLAVVAYIWFDPIKSVVMLLSGIGLLCTYYEERERDLRSDLEAIWKKRVSDLNVKNFCLGQDMATLKRRADLLDRENDALAAENAMLRMDNWRLTPPPPANPNAWRGSIILD
jgi:hypothetical protein